MFNKIVKKDKLLHFNPYLFSFLLLLLAETLLWNFYTKNIKPDFSITPIPPSKVERAFLSLGDNVLLYRIYAMQLQNAGDTFGETIPLKDYDYQKLEKWFYALNELDQQSEYVPSIAGFYYAQSQSPYDNKYIVSYLTDYAKSDPVAKWRWFTQAAYLARHKLHDMKLATEIASNIISIDNPNIPGWAKAMALFIAQKDDPCTTLAIANKLMRDGSFNEMMNDKVFSARSGEYNFMYQAIKRLVKEIETDSSIVAKCKQNASKKQPNKF